MKKLAKLLSRLLKDRRANTLALGAIALIPLIAMIGSAVDVSRAYMAKNRLQSACDASSLAARRVMKFDNLDGNVIETGQKYFDVNFPNGKFGTAEFEPEITKPEVGVVRVEADTSIPNVFMQIFGFDSMPLHVDCDASLNFVNTDVVLVLDVTGSMKDSLSGVPKIEALQEAVLALYDELAPVQAQLESQGLRLRYGIVPYSSTVNVGRLLYAANPDYIRKSNVYPSRVANFNKTNWTRREFSNWTYKNVQYDLSNFVQPGGTILLANNATGTVANQDSYNAQQLAAAATGGSNSSFSWNGCIEERETTTSINGGISLTIPSEAHDLNINEIPSSDATRWRPQLPEVIYSRTAGRTSTTSNADSTSKTGWIMNYTPSQGYSACPTESRRLTEWTRDEMDGYISGLETIGGTYHDIGMIWGARMVSTGGVFADGCEEYNEMPCNRHIIFMTDDAQTAYCNVLTAYGLEQNEMRVLGATNCEGQDPRLLARHQQRFRMACNAAKNMDTSVWVIAFGTSLTSNLTGCASNSGQATVSSDGESLIERFRQIGNQIGALRLVK